jgi:prepilin signal peptidase PulO-like enzyme (type II secretory pathway)
MNDTLDRTFPINSEANYTLVDDTDLNFESFNMDNLNINSDIKDFVQQNSTFSFYSLIFLILIIIMIVILRFFTRKFPINFNSEKERKNTKRMNDAQCSFIVIYYIIAFVFYVYTAANLTVTWQKITFAAYSFALFTLLCVYFSIKLDQHRKYMKVIKVDDDVANRSKRLQTQQGTGNIQLRNNITLKQQKTQGQDGIIQNLQKKMNLQREVLEKELQKQNTNLKNKLLKNTQKLDSLNNIKRQEQILKTDMANIQAIKARQQFQKAQQQARKAQKQAIRKAQQRDRQYNKS